jgi:hypothetical protein
MDFHDAVAIRVRHLNGKVVDAAQVEEAIRVIRHTHRPVGPSRFNYAHKGNKPRAPKEQP